MNLCSPRFSIKLSLQFHFFSFLFTFFSCEGDTKSDTVSKLEMVIWTNGHE